MPFRFDHNALCPACPYDGCIEDRRLRPIQGRSTRFRLKQHTAFSCTFADFVPGTDSDPDSGRTFDDYIKQFRANALTAGQVLFKEQFKLEDPALAKVEGDVFELIECGALWNAAAIWNQYMDTGQWISSSFAVPPGTVPTPTRKVAIIKLPRGYDATKLFKPEVRSSIQAHEEALRRRSMILGLSVPDLVGIRIPDPIPSAYIPFLTPFSNLGEKSRSLLDNAYTGIVGTVEGRSFLFAIAVKRTIRSDRLYQPLFEANVLKYLIDYVLRGAAFRFHVHVGCLDGADVVGHYKAASLISLIRGGEPTLAVDRLLHATSPRQAAQDVLNDLPLFPI